MLIRECNAVHTLLCHLLNLPSGTGLVPTDGQARAAAAFLAERSGGLTAADVHNAWPDEVSR